MHLKDAVLALDVREAVAHVDVVSPVVLPTIVRKPITGVLLGLARQ